MAVIIGDNLDKRSNVPVKIVAFFLQYFKDIEGKRL